MKSNSGLLFHLWRILAPAASGPNYCNMSIWDDGLIRIDHKKSLRTQNYLYFSMDADKATNTNNFVFEKLSSIEGA